MLIWSPPTLLRVQELNDAEVMMAILLKRCARNPVAEDETGETVKNSATKHKEQNECDVP
jgi:hypothetical protein